MARLPPIEIVHLAYTTFPADPRVKRETYAASATGRRVAVVALRGPGERATERLDGVTVIRVPTPKSRGGAITYLREYLAFTLRCRFLLARHRALARVRVVHVHTLPDFLVWAARARPRARVILDLHEILPEFARAKYPGPLGRMAEFAGRRAERWSRRRADVTITVNRPIDALLQARPISRPERRVVIHNSPDPEDFGGVRNPFQIPESTVELVYHGSLTPLYGLDVAIRGVAEAQARGVRSCLTILGDGPERAALGAMATELQARVGFEARLPQGALPERLTRASAGVVPTRLDQMTRYSLSNKLLEYVHLGIPVLAARLPAVLDYFPEEALWYWSPNDAQDLARALQEFAQASLEARMARARLAQAALTSIAWPRERERLLGVYRELLAGP